MRETYYNGSSHAGWGVLSFFFPIVGIILALVWHNSHSRRARACIVGVLVVMSLSVVFNIISYGVAIYKFFNPSYSGTGLNWNQIVNYSPSHEQFRYPLAPNPNSAVYTDSPDGVLKFYMTGEDLPTVYDQATNTVIACDKFSCCIYVYNAANGKQIFTKEYPQTIDCFAVYGGNLVVSLVNNQTVEVLNLTTFASRQINAKHYAFSMVVTDDGIIFTGNDNGPGWSERNMYSLTFSNGYVTTILSHVYDPTFAVNYEKDILYVAERNVSSCALYYVNLKTYQSENKADFSQYEYSKYELFYDGTYVHAYGNLYDTVRGNIKYQGQSIVKGSLDYTPYSTLCIDGIYSLTVTTACKTLVYDSNSKKVLSTLDLYATRIYSLGNNKYIALCGESGYFCLIDINSLI